MCVENSDRCPMCLSYIKDSKVSKDLYAADRVAKYGNLKDKGVDDDLICFILSLSLIIDRANYVSTMIPGIKTSITYLIKIAEKALNVDNIKKV